MTTGSERQGPPVGRRAVVLALVALGTVPRLALAQAKPGPRRIAAIWSGSPEANEYLVTSLKQALAELGWVEGRNLVIESRWARGDNQRLPALFAEVLRLDVELVVTTSTPGALAAKTATTQIPVVFAMVSDPVASGVVSSLARPGGNLTGWSNMLPETSRKLVELMKDVVPKATRLAVLHDPSNPGKLLEVEVLLEDAHRRGMSVQSLPVRSVGDIGNAFAAMARERPDGLVVLQDTVTGMHRKAIVEHTARARLPAIYQVSGFVDLGGLMSYGLNIVGQYRRTAIYVDRILRGAKPGDLAVEQPTVFELVINKKTASALGLTIPQSVLLRADRVID